MYSTSSQKREWTYTADEISLKRAQSSEEEVLFLSPDEEFKMIRFVEVAAIRFSDSFRPAMWPSVRWTAYAYFKRLFLEWSVMEASPKVVMMACFYLAMKTDEFYVTIDEFVSNLKSLCYSKGRTEAWAGLNTVLETRRQSRPYDKKKEDPIDSDDE
uniref:Cyclin N-terminal domain-containing protein n=1 Tax=Heterorhabditis bacteriophora TaxID=37862 RepID=A0A1I7XC43_HETBA